ncbi:MAG: hypothetical protein ACOC71_07260, partial [Hyphomicrobiales bacterium]
MRLNRIGVAGRALGACLAVFCMTSQPAMAGDAAAAAPTGSTASAKADKLPIAPPKGDLLDRPAERADATPRTDDSATQSAAAVGPAFAVR